MFLKIYYFAIIMFVGIVSYSVFPNALAQTNSTVNTFVNPKSGISFHYPSDWHVASQEYTKAIFGNTATIKSLSGNISSNTVTPIVILFPESLNGASVNILSEALPFPMTVDKYFENSKNQLKLLSMSVSKDTPISIGNLNGVKYNIILPNGISETQMLFTKGSNGIIITYIKGITGQSKSFANINSIINSLTFKPNSQITGSSGGGNVKNTTSTLR